MDVDASHSAVDDFTDGHLLATALLARVPQLAGVPAQRVTALRGGITNTNYHVNTATGDFVLRITGERTHMLGIDRQVEHAASRSAAAAGLSPAVVHLIEPEGYLVTNFIVGRMPPPEELRSAHWLDEIGAVLRRVHALPAVGAHFSGIAVVRRYAQLSRGAGVEFPANFDSLLAALGTLERALARRRRYGVPIKRLIENQRRINTMMFNLRNVLPANTAAFNSFPVIRWLTVPFLVVAIVRSCIHLVSADGGAQSIAGIDTAVEGGNNIIALFHQWGAIQLILAVLLAVFFIRYPGLTPLVLLALAADPVLRDIAGKIMPITSTGTPPGATLNGPVFVAVFLLFVASLAERKNLRKS